jgi:Opioid growth factor receptor (OGFr) conserved region
MSKILAFYRGDAPDNRGRLLRELWAWNDAQLEQVHDFIQWMFPLPEPSAYNASAPLLTSEDEAAFHREPALKANLLKSSVRILRFLGLSLAEDGSVQEGPNFGERQGDIWSEPNHNWLRVTRILRSLRLLGLESVSLALYRRLQEMYQSRRFPIRDDTFRYWTEAVREIDAG